MLRSRSRSHGTSTTSDRRSTSEHSDCPGLNYRQYKESASHTRSIIRIRLKYHAQPKSIDIALEPRTSNLAPTHSYVQPARPRPRRSGRQRLRDHSARESLRRRVWHAPVPESRRARRLPRMRATPVRPVHPRAPRRPIRRVRRAPAAVRLRRRPGPAGR